MTRRTMTTVAATLGVLATGALVGLAGRLASDRERALARYQLELVRLRQEAARPPAGTSGNDEPAPAPAPSRTVCVGGVETLASAALRAQPSAPLVREGRLDVGRLSALSGTAVRAERWVEEAHEPPVLPRRLGCGRIEKGRDGHERCEEPLDPARTACGGQAFASFPIAAAAKPATATPPSPAKAALAPQSTRGPHR